VNGVIIRRVKFIVTVLLELDCNVPLICGLSVVYQWSFINCELLYILCNSIWCAYKDEHVPGHVSSCMACHLCLQTYITASYDKFDIFKMV